MKKLLLKLSAVMLLVVCLLSSCEDTLPEEMPKKDPVEYHVSEVIKVGGDSKLPGEPISDISDEQVIEEGVESIKTKIGEKK